MKETLSLIAVAGLVFVMAPSVYADAARGQGIYMNFCAPCHAGGITGAPKVGDHAEWSERGAKGVDAVVENAINGYQGKSGVMPARGGNSLLTDEEVTSAVMYMLEQSR